MKYSRQRELILNEVKNSNQHPTADSIYDKLKKESPGLSLGTVYRNLSQLESHGMIRKTNFPGEPVRFDGNLEDHDHFICEVCGEIYDIDKSDVNLVDTSLSEKGFVVESNEVILRGICVKCSNK